LEKLIQKQITLKNVISHYGKLVILVFTTNMDEYLR